MPLSTRTFCLGPDDTLYQLSYARFTGLMRRPPARPVLRFAAQRVRCAQTVIEVQDRKPIRVFSMNFYMLEFDGHGALDSEVLIRRAYAARRDAARVRRPTLNETTVVNATNRFVAAGGRWTPSDALTNLICDAALGNVKVRRL